MAEQADSQQDTIGEGEEWPGDEHGPLPHKRDEIRKWFPHDRERLGRPFEQPVPDKTFELALVLGGTVSAGAYTAGVLDFLIEALDCWQAEKNKYNDDPENSPVPMHDVKLKIITGASGGGMCATIFGIACRYKFPHVHADNQSQWELNPFYKAWVQDIDITELLKVTESAPWRTGPLKSFLNCEIIDRIADDLVAYPSSLTTPSSQVRLAKGPDSQVNGGKDERRPWLDDYLRVSVTLTNLRGVPFALRFPGHTGIPHEMRLHADFMHFAMPAQVQVPTWSGQPDVIQVPLDPNTLQVTGNEAWGPLYLLRTGAKATGAFPFALEPRELRKDIADYSYRFVSWRGASTQAQKMQKYYAAYPTVDDDNFHFLNVDGGALNNEPYELARKHLAGTGGRNPREGTEANRAVIMIDPLHDQSSDLDGPEPGEAFTSLLGLAGPILGALMGQARFKPEDLGLMQNDDVYSRAMIAPKRGNVVSDKAIATSGLGAFLGFFSEHYRHHDFVLGRRNAQRFLSSYFGLPADRNPSIDHKTNVRLVDERSDHSPIIPLYGTARDMEVKPAPWPKNVMTNANHLRPELEERLGQSVRHLAHDMGLGFVMRGVVRLGWFRFKRKLSDKVLNQVNAAIRALNRS